MTKQEFLDTIADGKWFKVNGKYGSLYTVKMKANGQEIKALWLSKTDPQAMCFSDYGAKDWGIEDTGRMIIYGAGTYHFGSNETDIDSIYDEDYNLDEALLFNVIINNADRGFITDEELKVVWAKLKDNNLDFEEITFE
ncbi:hypothetical protein A616_17105 [Brevibacillus brevis X23]|nr:hypothetical protein A616_17105 [Brevibacillus brevis X23]